ncbi:MAG: CDP-diacylglycerol--serine O-phosphatidyltransferase [Bryobacteraceae bacterium]|nr:CDP-diacylglycerol--serine O-phosphatidyltransferase [Bryobacteraceae bacterium]
MRRREPELRRRRAAYALPTLFTAGNLFLGFLAIVKSLQGALAASANLGPNPHLELAAKAIGVAVVLDGLDGRIARLTHTVSDFGRELDSLSDLITFGLAPAVLALVWGVQFAAADAPVPAQHLMTAGYFVAFLYLLCGAARLARFNVQVNPVPKNPGRPDRKYFVGLPIPGAAALVAAVVYACDAAPLENWLWATLWMVLLAMLGFLMVSTWRYRSFKEFGLLRPRSPLTVVLFGSLIYILWFYTQPVLLGMAAAYVGSGMAVRAGGLVKRWWRPASPGAERQIG